MNTYIYMPRLAVLALFVISLTLSACGPVEEELQAQHPQAEEPETLGPVVKHREWGYLHCAPTQPNPDSITIPGGL